MSVAFVLSHVTVIVWSYVVQHFNIRTYRKEGYQAVTYFSQHSDSLIVMINLYLRVLKS